MLDVRGIRKACTPVGSYDSMGSRWYCPELLTVCVLPACSHPERPTAEARMLILLGISHHGVRIAVLANRAARGVREQRDRDAIRSADEPRSVIGAEVMAELMRHAVKADALNRSIPLSQELRPGISPKPAQAQLDDCENA